MTVFDKAHDPNPDPEKRIGCSFDDFIALKNKKNIGEKASFDADDTQVTFSYFGKDTVIRYDEIIKDLKLERHNDEYNTKTGIQRYYVETLRIITSKGRIYHFSARMDIDYEKVARTPASLTAQFENSQFSRLKMYIEEHRK